MKKEWIKQNGVEVNIERRDAWASDAIVKARLTGEMQYIWSGRRMVIATPMSNGSVEVVDCIVDRSLTVTPNDILDLLAGSKTVPVDKPDGYEIHHVPSSRDLNTVYTVRIHDKDVALDSCSCPAFIFHPDQRCKHIKSILGY